MIPVVHQQCGKVALYYRRKLHFGDRLWLRSDMEPIEGASFGETGDLVRCGACGQMVTEDDLRNAMTGASDA